MGFFADKWKRGTEALHLLFSIAGDMRTRKALFACYRALGKPERGGDEVDLLLKIAGRRFPFHMKKSDIFTLAEILHEGQYRVRSAVPDAPVVIDAGANVGVAAVWFLGSYPGAKVHCFEPSSANFGFLEPNVGPLEGATVNLAAVGAEAGEVTLHLADHGAMHSVVDEAAGERTETVPQIALADYLEEHGIERIDLLKMDVEGAELSLLQGLGDRIRDVGVMIGEMHETLVPPDEFYGFLDEHGFRVVWKTYFGDGEAEGVHGFEAVRDR